MEVKEKQTYSQAFKPTSNTSVRQKKISHVSKVHYRTVETCDFLFGNFVFIVTSFVIYDYSVGKSLP